PGATLALPSMDGVFLSPSEDEFVGRIAEELGHFLAQGQHHRVLLFPPLSSRLRYLIHRTVENMDLLSSFSVGEGWRRRTVICHSAVRLPNETSDPKPAPNPTRPHRPAQPWGRGGRGTRPRHGGDIHGDNSRACVGSGRISRPPRRKPDKALYVPKVGRKKANWRERDNPEEAGGDLVPGDESCPKNSTRDIQEESKGGPEGVSVALGKQQEPGEEGVPSQVTTEPNAERSPCATNVPSLGNSNNSWEQEGLAKDCSASLPSGPCSHPAGAEEQGLSCANTAPAEGEEPTTQDGGMLEKEDKDVADGPWRDLDVPAGDREQRVTNLEEECTAELLAEIVGNLTVKDIDIERVSVACDTSGDTPVSEGDLGHVTEIYDFPSSLKTEDLLGMFSDFHESGFKIQWVDETHALGIFSSPSTASQALGRRYPCLKIRPLVHASRQSRLRALHRPKLLQLGKERPQTDTAVARRLVSHALGWRHRQQEGSGSEVCPGEPLEQQE
ncbi:R3HC1 protein, partial [Campylorhamphus procurvoides]|nr:R3HC1 protein [Campylorhamphus procurvoides]